MTPEWFKVGVRVTFMGFPPEVEVISIDTAEGSWIGMDIDGQHKYPLDEVSRVWLLVSPRKNIKMY